MNNTKNKTTENHSGKLVSAWDYDKAANLKNKCNAADSYFNGLGRAEELKEDDRYYLRHMFDYIQWLQMSRNYYKSSFEEIETSSQKALRNVDFLNAEIEYLEKWKKAATKEFGKCGYVAGLENANKKALQ